MEIAMCSGCSSAFQVGPLAQKEIRKGVYGFCTRLGTKVFVYLT